MKTLLILLGFAVSTTAACTSQPQPIDPGLRVGRQADGSAVVPTGQALRPWGRTLEFGGRPVDLAMASDGSALYLKDDRGLVVVDPVTWSLRQELAVGEDGTSMFGLAVSGDGRAVYVTTATNALREARVGANGILTWGRRITLPGPSGNDRSFPCGIALSRDGKRAWVCLSRNNSLAEVDLEEGRLLHEITVGVAPYAVLLSPDQRRAWVSNWGGRAPRVDELHAPSSGTPALVDRRGIAASGTVSIVDLEAGRELGEVAVGLSPNALAARPDGSLLYVANANSDTVSVIDPTIEEVVGVLPVRPDSLLPFGSMPNGLALSADGRRLYVSLAGDNAVEILRLSPDGRRLVAIEGLLPTDWYPGSLLLDSGTLYVANLKGVGSLTKRPSPEGWNSHWHRGSVQRVEPPRAAELARATEQARRAARLAQVGAHPGRFPRIRHVVYVIKENRTYDQILGDLPQGNGDPNLCSFGREVTPNHHALAEDFVLLDNYYCNGVLSADGHSWATEGNVTPYLERSFGGFSRSYTFGNDPLTYSSSGFLWDHVLDAGLSFRNFGEFDAAVIVPPSNFVQVYQDYQEGTGRIHFAHDIGVARLRAHSNPLYPGWNLDIPDQVRASIFLDALGEYEKKGYFPELTILYLPNDHTSGTAPGHPTPRAMVADNDLALGRIVEGISKSSFWPDTCIFVIEDDPQNGYDHVDGHRSLCLVVSPHTRGRGVVSHFYNQGSVMRSIEGILGIDPTNQLYGMAPTMEACFRDSPDPRPYHCLPGRIPLTELNPEAAALSGSARHWAERSAILPLDQPDQADEDTLNRIIWSATRGDSTPYPIAYAGAHGRGLAALGLRLDSEDGIKEE